jgi:cell division septum initiation protein DivIVA
MATTITPPNIETIERQLDELEARLSGVPAQMVALGRAMTARTIDTGSAAACDLRRRFDELLSVAESSSATALGQLRSSATRAAETTGRMAKEAAGQARAQVDRVTGAARDATARTLDDATRAADPDDDRPARLEAWTKSDLYERARELDIDGRSTMDKRELVAAIRRAE